MSAESLADQLTSRDTAVLTWVGLAVLWAAWSAARGGDVGRSMIEVLRIFFGPRVVGLVALVAAWQVLVVYLAARIGLWDFDLFKDTVVIVGAGAVMSGFKALAVADGKATMRGEARSLIAFVVIVQFLANLETFPYVVELILLPIVALLGGMQAVANHSDENMAARPVINGMVMLVGWVILGWSIYKVAVSVGSTEWEAVGKSFALAFWLPFTLLPAIYLVALLMQYGRTISMMKVVRSPSLGARIDFYRHHGFSLRRLSTFARTPGRAREYARADTREGRLAILQGAADG